MWRIGNQPVYLLIVNTGVLRQIWKKSIIMLFRIRSALNPRVGELSIVPCNTNAFGSCLDLALTTGYIGCDTARQTCQGAESLANALPLSLS